MRGKRAKTIRKAARVISFGMSDAPLVVKPGTLRNKFRIHQHKTSVDGTILGGKYTMKDGKPSPKFIQIVKHVPERIDYKTATLVHASNTPRGVYRNIKKAAS